MGLEGYVVSNLVVAVVLLALAFSVAAVRRSRLWREAFAEIGRRRPVAVAVVAVYVALAGFEAVAWIDSAPTGETTESRLPRSLLDRMFPDDFRERSYSAPLASVEFYGDGALRRPGAHWLGTDKIGRDVLKQTLKGAKVALLIGGLTSSIAILLALALGVSAGYLGGRFDDAVFFVMSTLASMPGLLLLIALIAVLGHGTLQVCIALGVTSWVGMCRLSRAETFKLRELDYVVAARALGVADRRIILRHILPNLMHLVVITFVLMFSGLVLSEAVLSWLGIGLDGSWGQMIDQARDELSREPAVWWNLVSASTALFVLILAVNRLGDAVRDVLDPRTQREVA
ncbi:MAG: ABC transporter permease [Myxococcales bacterium]|nr:ABC transporter permease [Myxococcales bacterium]